MHLERLDRVSEATRKRLDHSRVSGMIVTFFSPSPRRKSSNLGEEYQLVSFCHQGKHIDMRAYH
jgi:hypothetical protein